jgi:hypothetical protein
MAIRPTGTTPRLNPEWRNVEIGQMYVGLINARNVDATLRWSRAQIFLVINSSALGVIPFLWSQGVVKADLVFVALLFLSVYGFLLSLLWLSVTYRANHWVHYWNDQLANLENEALLPQEIRVFSQKQFEKQNWTAPSFHHTLVGLAWSFIVVWVLVFLGSTIITVGTYKVGVKTAETAPQTPTPPITAPPITPPRKR